MTRVFFYATLARYLGFALAMPLVAQVCWEDGNIVATVVVLIVAAFQVIAITTLRPAASKVYGLFDIIGEFGMIIATAMVIMLSFKSQMSPVMFGSAIAVGILFGTGAIVRYMLMIDQRIGEVDNA